MQRKNQIEKLVTELQRRILKSMFMRGVEDGRIDLRKPTTEVLKDFLRHGRATARSIKCDKKYVFDHRTSILRKARAAQRASQLDWACVFYATYFEHWINWLIIVRFQQQGYSQERLKLAVRMKPGDKFALIPVTLQLPPFPQPHLNAMTEVTNLRNELLHYKYGPEVFEKDGRTQKYERACERAERLVRYLARYANANVYKGKKKHIDHLFSGRGQLASILRTHGPRVVAQLDRMAKAAQGTSASS